MADHNTVTARQQVYQTHHRDEAYWTPAPASSSIEIISTQLTLDDADFPPVFRGKFKAGFDPRRHKFTRDECVDGFWAALESIQNRYPNAITSDGRHISCNFLKSRAPLTYSEARRRHQHGTPRTN